MQSLRLQRTVSGARVSTRRRCCVVRYRGAGDRKEEPGSIHVYTSDDARHGGLAADSCAVLMALVEKKLPFEQRKVDLAAKPEEFVELYHSIIPDKEEAERVPLLVNGTHRLADAATIVEYLAAAYPDSGTPLAPPDAYTAARVRLFTRYFMDHVVAAYTHLLHVDEAAAPGAAEALLRALAAVDEFLKLHGAGEGEYALGPHWSWSMSSAGDAAPAGDEAGQAGSGYLIGQWYTTAEVLCTPHVMRMVQVLPEWRGLDVLAECDRRKLARVAGWMRACLARKSAQLVAPRQDELVSGMAEYEWSHKV